MKAGINMAKSIDSTFHECRADENANKCVEKRVASFEADSAAFVKRADFVREEVETAMKTTLLAVETSNKEVMETFREQLPNIEMVAGECMES